MSPVAERHETYLAAYDQFAKAQGSTAPAWLQGRRARASKQFAESGFPTTRQEDWRFTNVAPIADAEFELAYGLPREAAALIEGVAVPHSVRLAIVNGEFVAGLSDLRHLPKGVRIVSLRDGVRDQTDGIEHHLATTFALEGHPFAALNTAFLDDGIAILVAPHAVVDTPIHVVIVTGGQPQASSPTTQAPPASARAAGAGELWRGLAEAAFGREGGSPQALKPSSPQTPVVSHPRTLVVAGAGSQVRIAQSFVGAAGAVYFTNAVTEVVVNDGARVEIYTDQRESPQAFHINNLQAHVASRGVFASHACATGARLMRQDIGVALKGEGADCTMNGVYLADGDRLMDTHTSLDHAMPHGTSHQIYKGILAGKARGVFNGRIIVRQDAQKTDAKQTNRALLLSDEAQINSNPQLEIFADDVKCTHGAAVGQLDEEAMFYLQARGLTPVEARDMLLHAFAGEVLEGIAIPELRAQIESTLFSALARDVLRLRSGRVEA